MADQTVKVSGPVKVVSDSPERVALDLAFQIASGETMDRAGWFKLYHQCWKAVHGHSLESIMKEK